jgi:hypothetical protein
MVDVFIPPNTTEGTTQHSDARPIGRKAAKKSSENERAVATLLAKIAKETVEKNRLLKEATREQIMARRLDGMSATQQRYYQIKQEQILTAVSWRITVPAIARVVFSTPNAAHPVRPVHLSKHQLSHALLAQ